MFKFNFDVDDDTDSVSPDTHATVSTDLKCVASASSTSNGKRKIQPSYDISLEELKLPESISYSPLHLPFIPSHPLLRRDLFDARFQLAEGEAGPSKPRTTTSTLTKNVSSGAQNGGSDEEEYIDAKTDLIPGLYEGGLKTWEGGVDLVEVVHSAGDVAGWVRGATVLEVGCGTAMLTCFLLRSLLASTPSSPSRKVTTRLHLQDFNLPVLSLVTLPNLILATLPSLPPNTFSTDSAPEGVTPNWTAPGEVQLTQMVLDAVKKAWTDAGVELRFTYGHWSGLADCLASLPNAGMYNLVMTAETIYSPESLPDLIDVLRAAQKRCDASSPTVVKSAEDLESGMEDLRLGNAWKEPLTQSSEGLVLVGAKVLYFGVGGDLHTFIQQIQASGGWVEEVRAWTSGVGRKVVRVGW